MMTTSYHRISDDNKYTRIPRPITVDYFNLVKSDDKSLTRLISLILIVAATDSDEAKAALDGVFFFLASYLQADGKWNLYATQAQWDMFNTACAEFAVLLQDHDLGLEHNQL